MGDEGAKLWEADRPEDSLPLTAERLVLQTRQLAGRAKTEEDLRIGFEKLLGPVLGSIGAVCHPQYERTIIAAGRADAVHGRVIIEYERPRSFRSKANVDKCFEQVTEYLLAEAQEHKDAPFLFDPKVVGVGFDGQRIFFSQYRGEKDLAKRGLDKKDFVLLGPYPFGPASARTLLTWMRALSRRLLTAEDLAEVFGPEGAVGRNMVSALSDALKHWATGPRVQAFFGEWRRLFGIVYGEHFGAGRTDEATELSRLFGVSQDTGFQELLFAVHTYFVLLMKLVAAELLTISEQSLKSSFSDDLAHADKASLEAKLADVESGGVFARRGITNFLEGDFFRWYLDALSPRLEEAIRDVARALAEFEPATATIAPSAHRDLLKKLYQYLVPEAIRHNLGEYYTPDWLAELVLREVGYRGDTRKRLLDPACGSGTFLVLAIQKAKQWAAKAREPPLAVVKRILSAIWGFDLNPLAVIAARTNYLFALGDLVDELPAFEVPVYLADSVLWPERTGQMDLNLTGTDSIKIPTAVGEFHVPSIWVKNAGFLMKRAAPLVEEMIKNGFSPAQALKRLKGEGLVFPPHEAAITHFYQELQQLEEQGKNGIWARFLKNAFAPMVGGRFGFVVGNPPWIRWGYLSEAYRRATLRLWQDYGLFSLKGAAARLGGGEKDFSMVFTYAAADYYLPPGGTLGFLITQEVFKSKGAGEGFRRFRICEAKPLQVMKAHDLVSVQPFEGAANKTAMIILRKGRETKYPVPYTVWTRRKGVGRIPTDFTLDKALPLLQKKALLARPIGKPTGSWQTLLRSHRQLSKIEGRNPYRARLGARVEPYGVFWLKVDQVLSDGNLLVSNMPERGKRDIPVVQERIEQDRVFPAVAGAHVERWGAVPGIHVLLVQDPATCEPYPEPDMKAHWPRTYGYLVRFRDILLSRGSKTVRQLAERTAFYAMFGIGPYTMARYKVVWKRMASDLVAAVVSQSPTPFGHKMVVPTDTTSLFAVEDEDEAHYLCAIVNSTSVRNFIKSYSSAGRGFGAPSVMEHVGIPRFDRKNALHLRLARLSRSLHRHKAAGATLKMGAEEQQVNSAVRRLFGLRA